MNNHRTIPNFDMNKLPEHTALLMNNRVAIVGAGAVGSYAAEFLVKQGVTDVTCIDMDDFETANIAKSSLAYRALEDDGRNKALALAEGLNRALGADFVHGINSDITNFGPMAFSCFDVIILALDNYAAKVFCGQMWLQLPEDKRPLMIFGGTNESSAQSNCIDGKECCIRCMFAEEWLENPFEKASCTGVNYRSDFVNSESSRTTGGASRIAADLMGEQCVGYLLGYRDMVNKRYIFNSYPNFGFTQLVPLRKRGCPDCLNYTPINKAEGLSGMDTLHTTVGELFDVIGSRMGEGDFSIIAPFIQFGNIGYSKIIKDDHCRSCGSQMKKVYRHEFRTKYTDMLCDDCKKANKLAVPPSTEDEPASYIKAITPGNCDEVLRSRTLYEIGFSIGAFIKVKHKSGGESFLDSEISYFYYYLENDLKLINEISEMEG